MKDRLAWEFDKYQVFRYNLTWCGRGDSSALMISSPGQSSAKERSCGNYGRDGQEEKRAGGTPHLPLHHHQPGRNYACQPSLCRYGILSSNYGKQKWKISLITETMNNRNQYQPSSVCFLDLEHLGFALSFNHRLVPWFELLLLGVGGKPLLFYRIISGSDDGNTDMV